MIDILTQLLSEQCDNLQPLERLLNSTSSITNVLYHSNLIILAISFIIISKVIEAKLLAGTGGPKFWSQEVFSHPNHRYAL